MEYELTKIFTRKDNNTAISYHLNIKELGTEGIKKIADILKVNKTITSFSLFYNEISDAGAKDIADMLKVNKIITSIHLGGNHITDAGAQHITAMLKENKTITLIDLGSNNSNNNIKTGTLDEINKALNTNKEERGKFKKAIEQLLLFAKRRKTCEYAILPQPLFLMIGARCYPDTENSSTEELKTYVSNIK